MVNLSFFDQSISGLHHTGNSHQSRGPSAIGLISWGAHQTMSTASKYKLQFQIWTSRRIFKVLGNSRPHATYCSFLSETQHLQARYEKNDYFIMTVFMTGTTHFCQCSVLLFVKCFALLCCGNVPRLTVLYPCQRLSGAQVSSIAF